MSLGFVSPFIMCIKLKVISELFCIMHHYMNLDLLRSDDVVVSDWAFVYCFVFYFIFIIFHCVLQFCTILLFIILVHLPISEVLTRPHLPKSWIGH